MAKPYSSTNANPVRRGFSFLIGAAFLALIMLICGLLLNSLFQLKALGQQLNTVVELHNHKIDLITQTQVAAHIRTDSLFRAWCWPATRSNAASIFCDSTMRAFCSDKDAKH